MEKMQKKQTTTTKTCYNSIVKIHVENLLWTGVLAGCQPAEMAVRADLTVIFVY